MGQSTIYGPPMRGLKVFPMSILPTKLDNLWTKLTQMNDQATHAYDNLHVQNEWIYSEVKRLSDEVRDESMRTGPVAFLFYADVAGSLHLSLVNQYVEVGFVKCGGADIMPLVASIYATVGLPFPESFTHRRVFSESLPAPVERLLIVAMRCIIKNDREGFLALLPWLRVFHEINHRLTYGSDRDSIMGYAVAKGWIVDVQNEVQDAP